MANITKQKREKMLKFIERLKQQNKDDESIVALNEIENALTEKKFGLVFEEHTEEADEKLKDFIPVLCEDKERRICKDETLPWNFIIEGDNLHALYLLEKTHKGKIDCIYIDPPYNTGARDWKYNNDYVDSNDVYRHSKWLSMMKSRLKIAKLLLSNTGVLICTIDQNELFHIGLLLEEIFPQKEITTVSILHNPSGTQGKNFSRNNEYALFVYNGNISSIALEQRSDSNADIRSFMNGAKGKAGNYLRETGYSCFYPIILKNEKIIGFGKIVPENIHPKSSNVLLKDGSIAVFPIDNNGIERKWLFARDSVEEIINDLHVKFNKKKNLYEIIRIKNKINYKTIWADAKYSAKTYGTTLIKNLIETDFSFPKSLYAVEDCIRAALNNKKYAFVLDFFAGSGTTQHAVNLLNKEDGGNRRCIMVTNNEISVDEEKKLTNQGFKKGDPEWEVLGIAKSITWPRTKCAIDGIDINGEPLKGNYLVKDQNGKLIPMAEGFKCNVKYFKCDWVDRKPEDYLLSNALCLHIKEMIELQNAIEVDNKKYILILNKSDFTKYIADNQNKDEIKQVWINQNIILESKELEILKSYTFNYIPKEFFGQELREVGE